MTVFASEQGEKILIVSQQMHPGLYIALVLYMFIHMGWVMMRFLDLLMSRKFPPLLSDWLEIFAKIPKLKIIPNVTQVPSGPTCLLNVRTHFKKKSIAIMTNFHLPRLPHLVSKF